MVEKILSTKSKTDAHAGDYVVAEYDCIFAHAGNRPLVPEVFTKMGMEKIKYPEKAVFLADHTPNSPSVTIAHSEKTIREFAWSHQTRFHDLGEGICHMVLPEKGYVLPGEIAIGTDSHACTYGALGALGTGIGSSDEVCALVSGQMWFRVPSTIKLTLNGKLPEGVSAKDLIVYLIRRYGTDFAIYKAVEFAGPAIRALSMDGRFTMCNMGVEMGAKIGYMEVDDVTREWISEHTDRPYEPVFSDPDCVFEQEITLDVSNLVPQVVFPPSLKHVESITDIEKTPVFIGIIGSCTNGRLEDLQIAANILKGKKIAPGRRLYVIPGSKEIYLKALNSGVITTFVEAGALIGMPGCNGCGGVFAVPDDGETVISTVNRNSSFRKGNKKADVYLGSPATVAASMIAGEIADPRNYI